MRSKQCGRSDRREQDTTVNGHDAGHVTETPDVSHIKNIDVTHEASDVSVSGILSLSWR